MERIKTVLSEFGTVEPKLWEAIRQIMVVKNYPKGSLLLEADKTCRYLWFMDQGITRGFYYKNGKEITTWFSLENDPCLSVYSFLTQKPSREYIDAVEDTVVYGIHHEHLQKLYQQFPALNLIGRILTESYYIQLEEHSHSLLHETSKERYWRLVEEWPELVQRVPLTYIASYLGMTKENLSRIRRI